MASSGNPDSTEHIIISHGSRRRLLAKPLTFELLMQRSCEIFGFAANTEVCAYFMYRNNLGNYVNMELDPSAYSFLKSGDELEWKSSDMSPAHSLSKEHDYHGPRYLGGGYEPTTPRPKVFIREDGSEQNGGWPLADEEDPTWAGGHEQTSPPGMWREDGGVNLDWRPENDISRGGVPWSPPPSNSRRSPTANAKYGVFSPRPRETPIDGDGWLRPLPSGYSPAPRTEGRWARDEGTPTKGPRRKAIRSAVKERFVEDDKDLIW
ncbi:hypothetical protein V8F20_011390 [Naviculisporaceae sp. PSN 640]